jgi:ankyrin repeat protein
MQLKIRVISTFLVLFIVQNSFSQTQNDIFDYIRDDNLTALKNTIKKDTTLVNIIDKKGFSPLILASYYHRLAIAKFLLEHNAKINTQSEMGTALMAATYKGDKEMVNLLLQYNPNTNLTDNKGTTALHLACIFNFNEIARLLLNHKANTNHKDAQNKTPLDYAILNKNIELIKFFENE